MTDSTTANPGNPPAVVMRGVVKRFPGVLANDGVNLTVETGEVHALLGENGAGKSTLMNLLFGLYNPDEGEIEINGQRVHFHNTREATKAGLGMVHQHFMLIPRFTVAENVILGNEGPSEFLDRAAASARVRQIATAYGLNVDPDAKVGDLPVGMQQRVEILRALYQGSNILILDEPTALLTPQEVEDLYLILNRLKEAGGTIIFITHKLREVANVSDCVTVIRRGKTIGTRQTSETTSEELAELMVGREVLLQVNRPPAKPGEVILDGKDLVCEGGNNRKSLDVASIQLRRGEILGVCGVEGNGQSELIEVLSGLRVPQSGTLTIHDRDMAGKDATGFRREGVAYIPEDRHGRGLVLDFPLWENVLLGNTDSSGFVEGGVVRAGWIKQLTTQLMKTFDVRAPSSTTPAGSLSGGNQQKLIIARELNREPDIVLATQPTRGLDVGAIEFVHRSLVEVRDAGKAVLLLSFDLDEILDMSDRIVVLCEGRVVGDMPGDAADRQTLGLLMGGQSADAEMAAG